jgi:cbb3-type cytochrome c oxidase subunit III
MIDTRISIGLVAVLVAIASVVYVGVTEADRQAEFKAAFKGRSIEKGAAVFDEYCSECHGPEGRGSARAPGLNTREFFDNRLTELNYIGTMESYVRLTVAGGRPVKSDAKWPQNMPTWSTQFGGPLRNDQVQNVTDFIMNWEETAEPAATEILVEGDTPEARGEALFAVAVGCKGCHAINGDGGSVGPDLGKVYTKGEEYVHQAIVDPNAVVAEGYAPGIMPQNFGETLSEEQISDLIAYFKSVNK